MFQLKNNFDTHGCGKLVLILGSMFSGKTTELLRRYKRCALAGENCVAIRYYKDNRYNNNKLATHDSIMIDAVSSNGNSLLDTVKNIPNISMVDALFFDEIQFYPDGATVCDQLANAGYDVYASGLQGNFKRKIWPTIAELIPYADKIYHLKAIDKDTHRSASFTARISSEVDEEVIGGCEKYIAVDRNHYQKLDVK